MATFIEPFDFYTIFVNYFLGSLSLFFFALVIVVSYACASFSMSNRNYYMLLAIISILFSAYLGEAVYFILFFVVGIASFLAISKLFDR